MGVIIYSFNLNISPKTSYGVLECDIVMLQNYMLMIFVIKDFVINKGGVICAGPYMYVFVEEKALESQDYTGISLGEQSNTQLSWARPPKPDYLSSSPDCGIFQLQNLNLLAF